MIKQEKMIPHIYGYYTITRVDTNIACMLIQIFQTEMVDRYCNQILSGEIKEDVELEYVEQLHILLESGKLTMTNFYFYANQVICLILFFFFDNQIQA